MGNEKNNLDDLIGTSGGSPIIVKESGSDKKILYILLIALLILFLLAIGLIAFLGGKYFSQNDNGKVAAKTVAVAPLQNNSTATQVSEPKATAQEVSELEKMVVKEEAQKAIKTNTMKEEKAIQHAVQATTGKVLSQEDLAKIAALVAKELAKSKNAKPAQATTKSTQQQSSSAQDDAALAAQLEQAQTDTLANEQTTVTANLKSDVKAGSSKKVDTFNKVIVSDKGANNDELAKLAQEIDTILKSEDVQKETKSVKYVKELSKEAAQRAKEMRFIVVKKGDTLSSIAYRAYGRASAYTKIYEANPDIVRNPNRIYVGMRLRVPVDDEYKEFQGKKNVQ